ncbi:hypothetical protein KUTeg_003314 [Tegillarca granosa]|uniref:Uncharacterized protein n=1 Tax=Tegillarca granosa TaxID=220873 RepID=A0ABQ9FRB0_TEGGR|nr:hypothetical protein KUTeg_003314 [Tegillarca granosa]
MANSYPLADLHPVHAEPNDKKCPELQLLEHAISNCAVPLVHQLIQQHPKVVFEKGWHGQTPLHKACLVGDWSIVFLLLEAGSDANALNEFDETPLHYACKRGVGSVVHLLIQRGANLEAVDKNGMGVSHHAAQTGSIFVFHLLNELGVNFTTVDRNLQTPLHIACKHGHVETFKFLVKKGRSNILQADKDGNNALHIAAIEGHSYLCWIIMSMTTCSTLHVFNRCGLTPRKLAEQRDSFGHQEIIPVMKYYETVKRDARPGGPISLWWGHFYVPGLYYALLIFFAALIGGWYQGFIVAAGMAFLILNLIKHTHRMIVRQPKTKHCKLCEQVLRLHGSPLFVFTQVYSQKQPFSLLLVHYRCSYLLCSCSYSLCTYIVQMCIKTKHSGK